MTINSASFEAARPNYAVGQILKLSVTEQMQELQATLSLNKSQLAKILRVSRPALCAWIQGAEPKPANTARLHAILRCLVNAQASSARPLNRRFVQHSVEGDGAALLALLSEARIDQQAIVGAINAARALDREATRRRADREERLRDRGFEEPDRERRRAQLGRNVALLKWPS